MTSRERVAAALNHQEADRVPLDLGSSGTTGIMVTTYAALRKRFGIDGQPPKVNELQYLWEVCTSSKKQRDKKSDLLLNPGPSN